MSRKLAAGNWKMNGSHAALREIEQLAADHPAPGCDVLICPPAVYLADAALIAQGGPVQIGAQDCHSAESGAHTGDVSAPMLAEIGASHVIIGHSERRADHGERNDMVRAKAKAVRAAGLVPIVCVGESLEDRKAGRAEAVVVDQVLGSLPDDTGAETVVAYEPIWAIGTGEVASPADIAAMHSALHIALAKQFASGDQIRLLYGGSVKPDNAAAIFALPHVDGALVGGASLKAADFGAIIAALGDS